MLDQPIYKDWILYLWLFCVLSLIPNITWSSNVFVAILDFAVGVVVQYWIFLRVPVAIRRSVRGL
jgi:hypothetical protein